MNVRRARAHAADGRARAVAAAQAGAIHHRQLRAAGLSSRQIQLRADRGELLRRHRGVYLIAGAPLTLHARVWAVLLACGHGAFASHRTAAVLWGVRRGEPAVIDVTVVGSRSPKLAGARVHRVPRLPADGVRTRQGIRLSSPPRVICELAAVEPREEVEYAVQEAAARLHLTPAELTRAAAAWRPRRGSAMLDAILGAAAPNEFDRSWAERRLRRIVGQAGLPSPLSNRVVRGHRVDAVWPEQRVIVLVDGLETHGTPVAFARDRVEATELTAAGWRVVRLTARQLRDAPLWVIAQLAAVLRSAA